MALKYVCHQLSCQGYSEQENSIIQQSPDIFLCCWPLVGDCTRLCAKTKFVKIDTRAVSSFARETRYSIYYTAGQH